MADSRPKFPMPPGRPRTDRCIACHEFHPQGECEVYKAFGVEMFGSMTPKQYADAIERLGLSQRAAGNFLGVDECQSRRWLSGESRVPESIGKLLRLMVKLKLSPEDVE